MTQQSFKIVSRNGVEINSDDEWGLYAPPKDPRQWQEGRSAKELAKSFFREEKLSFPEEVLRTLDGACSEGCITIERVIPEKITRLDNRRGEHRNHDLYVEASCHGKSIVICVEAKVDEEFDNTLKVRVNSSFRNPKSQVKPRVNDLSHALFGRRFSTDEVHQGDLRYQLLTAISGTMIEATKMSADKGIFVVYEFRTTSSNPRDVQRNERDLNDFVRHLSGGQVATIVPGVLYGPLKVRGSKAIDAMANHPIDSSIPLYIAKVVKDLT